MNEFNSNLIVWKIATLAFIVFFATPCTGYEGMTFSSEEGLDIISQSRNFSAYANETVQLPCLIKKQTPNTVVIWNQCDDPACEQVRNPLTINKDNFIQDLRFRVLYENLQESIHSSEIRNDRHMRSRFRYRDAEDTSVYGDINKWTLEIRKFSKKDEGCYQCQLNSMDTKTIYYCINMQKKVYANPEKVTVSVGNRLELKCQTDENVRLSSIKWYRDGHRLITNKHINIHSHHENNMMHSRLVIPKSTFHSKGTYSCKFDDIHARMYVNVVAAGGDSQLDEHSLYSIEPKSNLYSSPEDTDRTGVDTNKDTTSGSYFDSYRFFPVNSNAKKPEISRAVYFLVITMSVLFSMKV